MDKITCRGNFNKIMKKLFSKIIHLILCLAIFIGFATVTPKVHADSLQQQLNQLNQQIQSTKNAANTNQQQINTIQGMIDNLNAQTVAAQKEIDLSNQKISVLNKQINETQTQINQKTAELKIKRANLNETIVTYYENSNNQSTLVTVIGSNNLSDAIDKAKYLEAIGGNLSDQINQVNTLMADLQKQQDNLQKQKTDQENQKTALADQQRNLSIQANAKNVLLSQASSKQLQLQSSLSQIMSDRDNVSAAIYAQRQAQGGNIVGGTGGYPYASSAVDQADRWGFATRECTSYAAWYFNVIEGKSWYNTRPGSGSAWNWPALAVDQGYTVSSTPKVGAIVSWPAGGILGRYGHVAIVQAVFSDGTFEVSQYNWVPFAYSEMHVSSSLASTARFIY